MGPCSRVHSPDIERLHILRRDLLRLRSAAVPLAEVCRRLEHTDVLPIASNMRLYFRDVTDHIHQVAAEIDSLRELLAFVFEASVMIGQMQQNDITRRLAAWAAILAVPTAVAGIYGMNFQNMPELKWEYGYLHRRRPDRVGGQRALPGFPPQQVALSPSPRDSRAARGRRAASGLQ